jgi:four helix bundle protein
MSEAKDDLNRRLYDYSLSIVKFVDGLPKDSLTQVLTNQLLRSGTSVTANIIEARGSSSKKDYINFYTYALKSANESKFWLNLTKDRGKVNSSSCGWLIKETKEIANILGASIITMKRNNKKT